MKEWNQYFSSHWVFNGVRQYGHIAMFPEELPKRLIKMFSFVGDTVVDPFSGSGTTMLAAINAERNSIGVETEELYCHSALQRLYDSKTLFSDFEVSYVDLSHERDFEAVPKSV